jgi:hypothetical protein
MFGFTPVSLTWAQHKATHIECKEKSTRNSNIKVRARWMLHLSCTSRCDKGFCQLCSICVCATACPALRCSVSLLPNIGQNYFHIPFLCNTGYPIVISRYKQSWILWPAFSHFFTRQRWSIAPQWRTFLSVDHICHKHSNVNTLRSHFLAWENNWNSERGCHDLPPTRTSPSSFSVWQAILASLTCWRDLIWSFVRPNKSNPPVKRHKILTQLQISLLKISGPFTCRERFCGQNIITWFSISDVPKRMLLIMSDYLHGAFFHQKMNLFL